MQIFIKFLSNMSKKRVINGVVAIAIAVALVVMVTYYWHKMGCTGWSLVAGIAWNLTFPAALWACVDGYIKEKEAK